MIIGIGTDIIEIARVERTLARFGRRFLDRVFTAEEQARAAQTARPATVLAKRWAAKEACWKALGPGSKKGIVWHDFTVTSTSDGTPILVLRGRAAERLRQDTPAGGRARIDLSLSDERQFAVAFVVISASQGPIC